MVTSRWQIAAFVLAVLIDPRPCLSSEPVVAPPNEDTGAADRNQEVFSRLQQIWEIQRDEIQTARIETTFFRYLRGTKKTVLPKEAVEELLDQIPLALRDSGIDGVRDLIKTLPVYDPSDPDKYWKRLAILVDGIRLRNTIRSLDGSTLISDAAFDGDREVQHWNDSKQVNVYGGSHWKKYGLSSIRSVPGFSSSGSAPPLTVEEGLVRCAHPSGRPSYVFDEESGLRLEYRVDKDIFRQYEPAEYAGGIVFPTASAQATFDGADTRILRLFLVTDAEFNTALPDNAFDVGVPADTVVVDYRGASDRPKTRKMRAPVDDVVASIDQSTRRPPPPEGPNFRWWIIGMNALLVAVALGYLAFARRRRARD